VSQVARVFKLNWQGFNLRRGAILAVILGLLIVVGVLPHERRYFLSAIFGALLVAVVDPGGEYANRVWRLAVFAVAGALLTALGFIIGGGAWGWVVLAAFVVTLLGGLAVKYGLHRFVAAYLLNVWFIIALGLGLLRLGPFHTDPWAQALAWLTGSAVWIACTFIMWLARGRKAVPQPVAEIPGDISPRPLTRPVILFAVIRAVAVAAAVAIAFGLHLPSAAWMPIAAIIAMKPDLQQSTFVAEQRVAGTVIGAAVAALVLLAVGSKTALEVIIVVLFALAGSIRTVSYTWYTAAVAGAVLIAMDVPHPSNLADEGRRILWTFAGVGIAVIVMFLADRLSKRTAKAAPPAPAHRGQAG
jgi:Fusaric acid resistance protein-like